MTLSQVYDKLNDTESRTWRQHVANGLFALSAFAGFTLVAMFVGWPLLGSLVWGAELDRKIAAQVEVATEPLRKELEHVRQSQAAQKAVIDDTRKLVIAGIAERYEAQIVDYKTKLCKAETEEARETWRELVLEYQRRYFELTGLPNLAPGCAEL